MATLIKDLAQIPSRKVRLVSEGGNVILDKAEAMTRASTDGLDLVLVQEGDIPVVKLCDFSKIEYSKQKSVKSNRPKRPKVVKIGPHTQQYDMQRIAALADDFIKDGHPVSVKMKVKGRDKAFVQQNTAKIKEFAGMVTSARQGISVSVSIGDEWYTMTLN